jgi:hypothetical protein
MVFANAAVSAAQKPCQPLRGQGIHSHSLKCAFNHSIGTKTYLCSYNGTASRKAVFPRRGVPLERKGQAPNGPPLIRGKTKGKVWVQGQRSSVLITPGYISGIPEVCKCKHQIKSGIILRSSLPWQPSLSVVSPGFSASPCQKLLM